MRLEPTLYRYSRCPADAQRPPAGSSAPTCAATFADGHKPPRIVNRFAPNRQIHRAVANESLESPAGGRGSTPVVWLLKEGSVRDG